MLGAEHPNTLDSASDLGRLYASQNRYDEAEPLFRRSLEARERVLGDDHPETLGSITNLAVLLAATNKHQEFHQVLLRWDRLARSRLGRSLASTRGAQVQRRQLDFGDSPLDWACMQALRVSASDQLSGLFADLLLRWKRLGSAEAELIARVVRDSTDAEVVTIARALSRSRANLAGMTNLPRPDPAAIARQREHLEELESQLATRSQDYRNAVERAEADWRQVGAALAPDSALVEWRRFQPFDFKTEEAGDAHWLAVLIRPESDGVSAPHVKDLGLAAPIDTLVANLLRSESSSAWQTAVGELYQALVAPLASDLEQVQQVVVSPDSLLDLVPFAELRTADGRYWIKQQGLRVVRTGRDLLPSSTTPTAKPNGLVAFGGIDYQRFADSEPKPAHRASEQDLIASRQLLGDQPRIGIPEDNSAP